MGRSLSTVKARVARLEARREAGAEALDWERLVAVLQSARTQPPTARTMTPEESAALSEQLHAAVRGTGAAHGRSRD